MGSVFRPKPKPKPSAPSPTKPEVSQATSTSMDGYDSRKSKAQGRSTTILTGAQGAEDEVLTLGRRTLLGKKSLLGKYK